MTKSFASLVISLPPPPRFLLPRCYTHSHKHTTDAYARVGGADQGEKEACSPQGLGAAGSFSPSAALSATAISSPLQSIEPIAWLCAAAQPERAALWRMHTPSLLLLRDDSGARQTLGSCASALLRHIIGSTSISIRSMHLAHACWRERALQRPALPTLQWS